MALPHILVLSVHFVLCRFFKFNSGISELSKFFVVLFEMTLYSISFLGRVRGSGRHKTDFSIEINIA